MELKFQTLCIEAMNRGDRQEMLSLLQRKSVLLAKIVMIIIITNTRKMLSKKRMRCHWGWSRVRAHKSNRESMAASWINSSKILTLPLKEASTIKILEFSQLMVILWMMAMAVVLTVERRLIYHYCLTSKDKSYSKIIINSKTLISSISKLTSLYRNLS